MPRLLTTPEVADLLNVSAKHVSRLRQHGLPSLKLGNAVRYRPEDVISFIENAARSFHTQDRGVGNE
jgi:excisionase family DNA binding protein